MFTMIGVWSDVSSRHDSTEACCVAISFVMQKSSKSGCLAVSLGKYVGCPEDRCCRLLFFIALYSSLPLVVVVLDPQYLFLAL